jgi:hypothetical protein
MRLNEFDITPAVVFHDQLNPALWEGNSLRPDVHDKLLKIADDFQDFIGVGIYDVLDVTISGSNAAFTYTPKSDIDLHLVVMIPGAHEEELRELFDAKKYQYNDTFDFKIHGYDVELYVQDAEQEHHSMGIYSVKNNKWLSEPKQIRATIDDISVENRYRTYISRIQTATAENDRDQCQKLWDHLKGMRQAGLAQGGEFSPENVTFKLLRAEGYLQDLRDHMIALKTQAMSMEDANA